MSKDTSHPPSVTHIRRCHVCGTVNESDSMAIRQCSDCGKHLAPFYYFDESKMEGLTEIGPYYSTWKQNLFALSGAFNPIWGLSIYWQENYEGQPRGYS